MCFRFSLPRLQVSVSLSNNESVPGDPVTLRVRGDRGSCVCVATVDKSLYLLKPDFPLTPDKVGILHHSSWMNFTQQVVMFVLWVHFVVQVFRELAEFDVSDVFGGPKDDAHFWWPGLSSRRRRRSSVFPWHWDFTKDARFAFTVRVRSRVGRTCPGGCFISHLTPNTGNGAGGDDRYGEPEPPAEWRNVHR